MEAPVAWTNPLLYVDIEAAADFIETATHCEKLAEEALETEHLKTQHDLYERLHECLQKLYPTLNDPIPEELVEKFTVTTPPLHPPVMDTESELLCEYCLALSKLLAGNPLSLDIEETLKGLLYELTSFLTDTMLAPRWLATADGLESLELE